MKVGELKKILEKHSDDELVIVLKRDDFWADYYVNDYFDVVGSDDAPVGADVPPNCVVIY